MRAKPKNEPLADRRRLLPQTSGARQAPSATRPTRKTTPPRSKRSPKPQFDSLLEDCKSKRRRRPRLLLEGSEETGNTRSRPTSRATAGPSCSSI